MLLIVFAVGRFDNATNLFSPAIRSILLASITAIIVVGIGLFLSFLTRINARGGLTDQFKLLHWVTPYREPSLGLGF